MEKKTARPSSAKTVKTAAAGKAKAPARPRTGSKAKPALKTKSAPRKKPVKTLAAASPGVFPEGVAACLKALSDKKVEDLNILKVAELVGFTDYFIIGTGNSAPHVQAMADAVTVLLKVPNAKGVHVEGLATGQWVLVDGGDFVVHLFQPDSRRFYNLDDLWADAPRLTYTEP